jgi:hypothetical protein
MASRHRSLCSRLSLAPVSLLASTLFLANTLLMVATIVPSIPVVSMVVVPLGRDVVAVRVALEERGAFDDERRRRPSGYRHAGR